MPPLLEVDRVSKSFGGVAANVDISFEVREGEILGLIGPNGAGKTSLFNAISGAVMPDAGEIRLSGRRISGLTPEQCSQLGIARTFQVVRSFDSMTVLENVMVGAFSRLSRTRKAMARALEMLASTGLAARRYAGACADAGREAAARGGTGAGDRTAPAAARRNAHRADAG